MLSAATAKRIGWELLGLAIGSALATLVLLSIVLTLWWIREDWLAPSEFRGSLHDLGLVTKLWLAVAFMILPTFLLGSLVVLWLRLRPWDRSQ